MHPTAGHAWALPCSALGLALAALWLGARRGRASWRFVGGVLEVAPAASHGAARRPLLPFDAITVGHVVLGRSPAVLDALRAHEHAHVAQYARWGALMLIAYPLETLWQALRGRRPYLDNRFEVQARACAAAVAAAAAPAPPVSDSAPSDPGPTR